MQARSLWSVALISAALLISSSPVRGAEGEKPKEKPDATLSVSATQVAAGVGYAWGEGQLTYQGKTLAVTIDGLTIGAVGVSSIDAVGNVYHLKKLEDFDGNYTAVVAGSTIGGGGAALIMRNPHGVEVRVRAVTKGVSLTAGTSGVKLSLKK